ncbi:hypothetical protein HOK51_01330 [Candidatus Woesearchaeota archaeon]|nr:hypothetical protein [Candidatus Woesearchaeota archaeon]MBT6518456.1 hypothetical protein [Candidatus Woesearchaeota archaeon]MBT7367044.1 hypothetical protein [Candidatus Woesearchaeota archaeon]
MLGKLFNWIILVVCLSTLVLAIPVEVTREISNDILPGETVDISLTINLKEEVSSVIVTELIPSGWELVDSVPSANKFPDNKIKWLVYGSSLKDGLILNYALKAPDSFSSEQELEGIWKTLHDENFIGGEYLINLKQVEEPLIGLQEDDEGFNTTYMLYIFGAIVLVLLIVIIVLLAKKKK